MATKRLSPLQNAFNRLKKTKKKFCEGKATKTAVQSAAKDYVGKAIKKGQTKAEAEKKANRVKNSGCKMTSRIVGVNARKKPKKK